jgi:hypothetical protein
MLEHFFEAAITAGVALTSAFATWIAKRIYDTRVLHSVSRDRRSVLNGRWLGQIYQERGPEGKEISLRLSIDFIVSRKKVSGNGVVWVVVDGKETEERFLLEGGFLHDQFLQLSYRNVRGFVLQFGAVTFRLSSSGESLKGKYAGYGSLTEGVVSGCAELRKMH